MKKINLILVSILSMTLFSCGGGAPNINEKEGIAEVKELMKDQFGGDREVYGFTLMTTDHLTSELLMASVNYEKEEQTYSQAYLLNTKTLNDATKNRFKNRSDKQIKISDLDFELISTKYDEAVKLIEKEGEMEDYTLHSWIGRIGKSGKMEASFTIEATKKGEGTSLEGRNVVTNYYEFEFEVDGDGNLQVNK